MRKGSPGTRTSNGRKVFVGAPPTGTVCSHADLWLSRPRVTTRPLFLLTVLATVMTGACGGEEDTRDPVWGYISPAIIQPNCATSSCHSKAAAVAGLDLSTVNNGYISLVQLKLAPRGTGANMFEAPRPMVSPGNPAESRVMHMLNADGARRMPPDRPLAGADVELIERWILNGAKND